MSQAGSRSTRVLAISGGVGGAKLALGLSRLLSPEQLTIVANTADDFTHLGLHVCPDIDTLLYTLAGRSNKELGWGVEGETWAVMDALQLLEGETWFRLGDRDLATHLYRTDRLARGEALGEVTRGLCRALAVAHPVVPMSDDPVRTWVDTDEGQLPFQDYFVRRQCRPAVSAISFHGVEQATPHPAWFDQLSDPGLDAVVICPSNPFVSVDPILSLPGVRRALADATARIIAVSPIIGGQAVKGPAAKMLAELGLEVSAGEVCRYYGDLLDTFVIDEVDATLASGLESPNLEVVVTPTLMKTLADKERLAARVLALLERT